MYKILHKDIAIRYMLRGYDDNLYPKDSEMDEFSSISTRHMKLLRNLSNFGVFCVAPLTLYFTRNLSSRQRKVGIFLFIGVIYWDVLMPPRQHPRSLELLQVLGPKYRKIIETSYPESVLSMKEVFGPIDSKIGDSGTDSQSIKTELFPGIGKPQPNYGGLDSNKTGDLGNNVKGYSLQVQEENKEDRVGIRMPDPQIVVIQRRGPVPDSQELGNMQKSEERSQVSVSPYLAPKSVGEVYVYGSMSAKEARN